MNIRKSISLTTATSTETEDRDATNQVIHEEASAVGAQASSGKSDGRKSSPSKSLSAIRPVPRRGLSRVEAAMYIGISTGKFDELVRTGRMPGPKRIDNRKVWDVHGLDLAFDELPSEGNSWDDV